MQKYSYKLQLMQHDSLPFFLLKSDISPMKKIPSWHNNLELIYILGGSGSVLYGEKQLSICCGDILVVNSHVIHTISGSEDLNYLCMVIDRNFCEQNGINTSALYFQEIIRDGYTEELFQKVLTALEEFSEATPIFNTAAVRSATLELLCHLCREYIRTSEASTDSNSTVYVKAAIEYIHANYSTPLTLDQIASHIGISKYYLCREFKLLTGRTIFEIIRVVRCKEARRMIEQGMPIHKAASACGFDTPSYFTRAFKKCFRELPSKYVPK